MRKQNNNTKASLAFDAMNTLLDNAERVGGEVTSARIRWSEVKFDPAKQGVIHCEIVAQIQQTIRGEATEKPLQAVERGVKI